MMCEFKILITRKVIYMEISFKPFFLSFTLLWFIIRIIKLYRKGNFRLRSEVIVWLFYFYIMTLINLTLFPFRINDFYYTSYNVIPFESIYTIISARNIRVILTNVLGNIVLFIPLGIFLKVIWIRINKLQVILISLLISCSIEFTQFFAHGLRTADIDDVILNLIGTIIGYAILKSNLILRFDSEKKEWV